MIEYSKIRKGQAVATVWAETSYRSNAQDGSVIQRVHLMPKVRIVGDREDVWDIVQRVQASDTPVMMQDGTLPVVPAETLPTVSADTFVRECLRDDVPAMLRPHNVISAIQLHVDRLARA